MAMQVKHLPKDAQVIISIMKDMGIEEYEPRVINQLLEFTYRKYEGENGWYVYVVLDGLKKWFKANVLALNFDKETCSSSTLKITTLWQPQTLQT